MKEQWLKYLSDQKDERLIPFMSKYFNDEIDFEELEYEMDKLEILSFRKFKKDLIITEMLDSLDNK